MDSYHGNSLAGLFLPCNPTPSIPSPSSFPALTFPPSLSPPLPKPCPPPPPCPPLPPRPFPSLPIRPPPSFLQDLLRLFGVPFITSPSEAESQCAWLDIHHPQVDGTITDDNDYLLFGGHRVYRHFFNQKQIAELYTDTDIQQCLGGCEECVRGVGECEGCRECEGVGECEGGAVV